MFFEVLQVYSSYQCFGAEFFNALLCRWFSYFEKNWNIADFTATVGEETHTHTYTHLPGKNPTNSYDAEDIEDGRTDDSSDSNIAVSDEDPWKHKSLKV